MKSADRTPFRRFVLTRERTDEARRLRRIYGDRGGHIKFQEKRIVCSTNLYAHTVTTFQKDNMMLVEWQLPVRVSPKPLIWKIGGVILKYTELSHRGVLPDVSRTLRSSVHDSSVLLEYVCAAATEYGASRIDQNE